jgi:hypothetical protein
MKWFALIVVGLAVTGVGCPTVDLGDVPPDPGQCRPDPGYYEQVIWSEFLAPAAAPERSCVDEAGCHRSEDGRSAFRLLVPPDGSPDLVDHDANYGVVTRFLNCGTPEASSLLSKPATGVDPHGGGDLFTLDDPTSQVFLDWFAQ